MSLEVYIPAAIALAHIAIIVTLGLVILLRKNLDSTTRIAWLLLIGVAPFMGAMLYLLIGEIRLGTKRIGRHREVVLRRSAEFFQPIQQPLPIEIEPPFHQIARLAEIVGGSIPRAGNTVELFGNATDTITAMVRDIDAAEHTVHLLTYIYLTDTTGCGLAKALIRAAERGVICRVLADAVGSQGFLSSGLMQQMTDAGVVVTPALPVGALRAVFKRLDLRNHRKITVVDGSIGYTGSRNIADASFAPKRRYAPWVDAMIRIEGPAVADLDRIFAEDWYLDTDDWIEDELPRLADEPFDKDGVTAQLVATGPNAANDAVRHVIQAALHLAQDEIILTTPYFVPDQATSTALMTAAQRGVDVQLIVPARNDSRLVAAASRSYYGQLLDAGVRIFEFTGGLLHAKTLSIDRRLGILTSANLDRRSLFLNFEASVIVYDTDFASQLRQLQMEYCNTAREIDSASWSSRHWPTRLWQNAAGLLSPLL